MGILSPFYQVLNVIIQVFSHRPGSQYPEPAGEGGCRRYQELDIPVEFNGDDASNPHNNQH